MKKIGFIDYYLDEWHANNYPKMIKEASQGRMEVVYAYGEVDAPGARTNEVWAKEMGIELLDSAQAVVEKSDYIIILAPNNPEEHPRICEVAANCKKPVYIDKTFACTKEDARQIFESYQAGKTPCWSASALAFSDELAKTDKENIIAINSIGSGLVEKYCIHQIEPIVALMGTEIEKVTYMGNEVYPTFELLFSGNRVARFTHCMDAPFSMQIAYGNGTFHNFVVQSPFFERLITKMIEFFEKGIVPISSDKTEAIIHIRALCLQAMEKPYTPVLA